jgi:hypothetical protein
MEFTIIISFYEVLFHTMIRHQTLLLRTHVIQSKNNVVLSTCKTCHKYRLLYLANLMIFAKSLSFANFAGLE